MKFCMPKKPKFYITTPIYYVNDKPHIGHVYTTIAADVIARLYRELKYDVFFLTGTDEYSLKGVKAAKERKMDAKKYIDEMAATWRETLLSFNLTFDRFIRTTSPEHRKAVELFYNRVKTKGDIYEGAYEGLYCEGCEEFLTEKDLIDEKCPDHLKKPKKIKEKNLFFRASRYRDALLAHIQQHPEFIAPLSRQNEMVNYIQNHFGDISITRQNYEWGIPVPDRPGDVIYVWFDALINYLSGIGFGVDEDKFTRFWPADVHLIGKGISKFHCALWPAMLLAADLPLPKQVYAHGYFTVDGKKVGKSLGNAIDPLDIKKEYSVDVFRYFVLREITFGQDGDFSLKRLKERYESDLANDYGNLVSRFCMMAETFLDGRVASVKTEPVKDRAQKLMQEFKFSEALELVWERFAWANGYIDSEKPWELAKRADGREKIQEVLGKIFFTLKDCAETLLSVMPDSSQRVLDSLSQEKIQKVEEPLFPKKDEKNFNF